MCATSVFSGGTWRRLPRIRNSFLQRDINSGDSAMLANTVPKMETLLIEKNDSTALVTLNRPAKRNSLDQQLISGLT